MSEPPVERVEVSPARIVALRRRVTFGVDDLGSIIGGLYDELFAVLGDEVWHTPGQNVIAYLALEPQEAAMADMLVGRHWEGAVPEGAEAFDLPGGQAAHLRHVGPYEELPTVHQTIIRWLHGQGLTRVDLNWDVYGDWSDDPAQRVTDVYYLM